MKIDFKDEKAFHQLEEDAIDGCLNYDDFPPCEYKYFSKLAKLGYNNRHKGWSVVICLDMQSQYRKQYMSERERFDRFYNMACTMQNNIRKAGTLPSKINKADNEREKLVLALQTIELMTGEDGFAKRNGVDMT